MSRRSNKADPLSLFICPKCGLRDNLSARDFPVVCRCGVVHKSNPAEKPLGVDRPLPSLAKRLTAYEIAVREHKKQGEPSRSDEEVARIFEDACRPCERFNGKSCTLCGCRVNKSPSALRNKIRMATEVCPIGRWGDFPFGGPAKYPRPTVRHLLYHVCPLDAEADPHQGWRQNLRQLFARWDLFNGRRIVAIVHGERLEPVDRVLEEFYASVWNGFDVVVLPNDPELREAATFPTLLASLEPGCYPPPAPLEEQAIFFAHTKGNSTEGNRQGAIFWRNAMYHHLLDRADECLDRLADFKAVGTHKMVWGDHPTPYPSGLQAGRWMFAGTFWWLRADFVFGNERWRDIPRDRYGVEAYPSTLFSSEDAHSMFQLWAPYRFPTPNPYKPGLYHQDRIADGPL